MLYAHSRYTEAMNLFETAQALQPNNIFYTELLFANGKSFYTRYEYAELLSYFIRQIYNSYEKGILSVSDIRNKYFNLFGTELINQNAYFISPYSVSSNQVKQLNRDNRKLWIELLDKALQKQLLNMDSPQTNDLIRAHLAWISSDDPEIM